MQIILFNCSIPPFPHPRTCQGCCRLHNYQPVPLRLCDDRLLTKIFTKIGPNPNPTQSRHVTQWHRSRAVSHLPSTRGRPPQARDFQPALRLRLFCLTISAPGQSSRSPPTFSTTRILFAEGGDGLDNPVFLRPLPVLD